MEREDLEFLFKDNEEYLEKARKCSRKINDYCSEVVEQVQRINKIHGMLSTVCYISKETGISSRVLLNLVGGETGNLPVLTEEEVLLLENLLMKESKICV